MSKPGKFKFRFIVIASLMASASLYAQPQVASFAPARFTMASENTVTISVQFDQQMDGSTFQSQNFLIIGQRTGAHTGTYNYDNGSRTATFTSSTSFEAGERVHVILTNDIKQSNGTSLTPFQWSFFIKAIGTAKLSLELTKSAGRAPHFVAVGDTDEDGDMDLAVANSKDSNGHIWTNDNADFSITETLNAGTGPRTLNIADYDADGDLDAAIVNENSNSMSIFRNDGTGNYSAVETKTTPAAPVWVTSGDLDGDGDLDLISVNLDASNFSVFKNNGNGTFQNKVDYTIGADPESAFLADFDTDGDLDIVTTSPTDNQITYLKNDGSGIFESPQTFNTGSSPRVITGQDYNSDGLIDVVTSNRDANSISVLLNSGSGFSAATDFTAGDTPFSVTSGDFDGDLDADLAVSNRFSNDIYVLTNDGTGTFVTDSTYSVGEEPRALNSGDLNGDGSLDIAVVNRNSNTLQVFLNEAPLIQNDPPAAPALNTPLANAHLNPNAGQIVLNWNVPADADGDNLHFKVDVSQAPNFSTTVLSADSRTNATGFNPTPPVAQGAGTVSYTISQNLGDGTYFWRVMAHDGVTFGAASTTRRLTIDGIAPNIDGTSLANPAPGFAPDWYNTNNVNDVDFQVQYDENNANQAVFNLGLLGGTQTVNNLSSGNDQTTSASIDLNGTSDGSYPLTVTISDSTGNQVTDNSASISLDGTPPSGTTASSPSGSQTLDFTVSWSGATDGSGSGLTGIYDIRVQVNGGSWTPWLTNFNGTSNTFNGENGNTYGFEAAAYDNVGNIEAFQNVPETTTAIDTTSDNVAPNAPTNLTANGSSPSPWQSVTNFIVSWQNPADQSGIARALYKLGTPPVANFDTTASVAGVTTFLASATQENGQVLYLWLQDNAGNLDFSNRSMVNLRYDRTSPTGSLASSPSVSSSIDFTVSWAGTGSDGDGSGLSGLYDVRVQENGGVWQSWLTNFSGTSATYSGQDGNSYGFEVVAYDVAGNVEAFTQVAESVTTVDLNANDTTAPGPPVSLLAAGSSPSPWQNSPGFLVNWQAPVDPSGIGRAFYKISSAPNANFDTTGSVATGSSMQITASSEDGDDFYLWFEDQKGNIDFSNHGVVSLRYDATPPEIFEMDFLNANFLPNWLNQNFVDVAQIRLEYTEKHADQVTLESSALDTTINLTNASSGDDVPVIFELNIQNQVDGLYQINFSVIDSAGNVERDSIDLALDSTAPTGALANAPDTSQARNFTVSWGGSGSDGSGSGLSGTYDVRVFANGSWSNWLTSFDGTSSEFIGEHGMEYGFEVLAHDNVGNVESIRNSIEASTYVDTSFADALAPTVLHAPQLIVDQGEDATISSDIQDNAQIVSARLFYRPSGTVVFRSMSMTNSGGNTYSATVAAAEIGLIGINYYIEASDGANISRHPNTNWDTLPNNLSVRILGIDGQGFARTIAQPAGTEARAYRMISIPLNLENSNPLAVLEDDLGSYDKKKWRLFQYLTSSDSFREHPNTDPFTPGTALWLIVKEANKSIDAGTGRTVVTNQSFEITLSRGWNDIGYPFTFPISSANVEVIAGDPNALVGPYRYEDQWIFPSQVTQLEAWEGYSFLSESDGLKIAIHPNAQGSQTAAKRATPLSATNADWTVNIRAYAGALKDENSRIGVSFEARESWDRLDFPEPPFISDFISVRFRHPEWQRFSSVYKTDFRPQFSDGQVWQFEVATTQANEPVKLEFMELASLPDNFKAILLDREIYQKFDLDNLPTYEFVPAGDQARKFDLIIGTESFIENSEAIKNFVPENFSLSQNFPNPFNAGTTVLYKLPEQANVSVKVMNILGQHVRTLVDEEMEPGVYRVNWNGRGDNGIEMSSGVYFIRLEARDFHQIRKVLYVR